MRIKRIEVVGFKSFADRQVFKLDDHITGVIGPNGCGKSNIVDAIRWCLGEQRAKHLRGTGMSDVIFSGCASRGPAASADVTIVFENEGEAAAEHLNFSEIAVTRRLYRDGTSDYLLNKVPCRLRDITELLMGTGVGSKGYSIIEQGRVTDLIASKPEQRRLVIDEAAGITKFKAHKAAAERRMDQTRQNLLRVQDVLRELDGRLGSLRKQAQKAERYRKYREDQRDLEVWLASHKFLELAATGQVLQSRHTLLHEEVDALKIQISKQEEQLSATRHSYNEGEQNLSAKQQEVYDLENRIQLIEQDRKFRRQEQDGLRRSIEQAKAEVELVQRSWENLNEELQKVQTQVENVQYDENGAKNLESLVEELAEQVRSNGESFRMKEGRAVELRSQHHQCVSELASLRARQDANAVSCLELDPQKSELEKKVARLAEEIQQGTDGIEQAKFSVSEAEQHIESLRQERSELDRERSSLKEHLDRSEVEVEIARKELVRTRSRIQSLEEIQARYQSCTSGVQVIMEQQDRLNEDRADLGGSAPSSSHSKPAVMGIMADFVSTSERYETALSAVLGDRLQGVVVDEPQVGANGVSLLKSLHEGRTTFLPAACRSGLRDDSSHTRKPDGQFSWQSPAEMTGGPSIEVVDLSGSNSHFIPTAASSELLSETLSKSKTETNPQNLEEHPDVIGRLSRFVEVKPELRPLIDTLLGDTYVVENLANAFELWQKNPHVESFVTLDGDRVEASGVVVGGASDAVDSALLHQKREIRELQEVASQLESEFQKARNQQLGFAERLKEVEESRERSESEILAAEKRKMTADQQFSVRESAMLRNQDEVQQCRIALDKLSTLVEQRREEGETIKNDLQSAEDREPQLVKDLLELEQEIVELGKDRERLSTQLMEAKVALARWQQQRDALQESYDRLKKQASGEEERKRRLEFAVQDHETNIETLESSILKLDAEHTDLLATHEKAVSERHDAREAYEQAKSRVDEHELAIRSLRERYEEERELFGDVELGLREIHMERDSIVSTIRERFDSDLEYLLIEYHLRPVAGDEQKSRADELRRLIARMGEVNLTAIGEFEEVTERFDYLSRQRDDLEKALSELQEAIDKINETTRERFQETFVTVNAMFQKIFPRLFAGGRAELVLTEPDDLLNTGVDIMAQPPGKKVSNLELLSGGEKALTAVSLIFGIFLIKPSPFCLLDEVDAPLDEANVGRFCDLVRELAAETQFIIITHNKNTMEIADTLYGVTMQQRGISKLVSVNMRKSIEDAQITSAPN